MTVRYSIVGASLLLGVVVLLPLGRPALGQPASGKAKEANEVVATFVYPEAKRLWDEYDGAGIYSARFTTPDDLKKVARWYKEKVEFGGGEGISINRGMVPGIRTSVVEDSTQRGSSDGERGPERFVNVLVCFRKTNDLCVNAVITRTAEEKETHVVLTVVDNKRQ